MTLNVCLCIELTYERSIRKHTSLRIRPRIKLNILGLELDRHSKSIRSSLNKSSLYVHRVQA